MNNNLKIGIVLLTTVIAMLSISCSEKKTPTVNKKAFIAENVKFAEAQVQLMLKELKEPTGKNYPRTVVDGKLKVTNMYDWTPGFFPGSLWYLYELTGDSTWRNEAKKWTHSLELLKTFTGHHDLGFMMYCSYGNAERLASEPQYKDILIESAHSLSTRYNETAKVIKSWNYRKTWDETQEMFYPVIIDNMMNLEMLMYASKVSGKKRYENVAVNHANTTLKNHFRDDYSSYHVVDYDTIVGNVKAQVTNQGYSDNSTWARGQAWAIYGYTMMYRETQNLEYLDLAINAADFYIANLPEDLIPVWDFNVGEDGYVPAPQSYASTFKEKKRDASAGAIACSALFELAGFTKNKTYKELAIEMLHNLASPAYRAAQGENGNFILMHSVGSVPHKSEIDAPLVYADYYFLEALTRYKNAK